MHDQFIGMDLIREQALAALRDAVLDAGRDGATVRWGGLTAVLDDGDLDVSPQVRVITIVSEHTCRQATVRANAALALADEGRED